MICDMKRLPIELQRDIMSYLRTCDICGKSNTSCNLNYCDFNCYCYCKQKQLRNCFITIMVMIFMFNQNVTYGILFMIPVIVTIDSLF